MNKIANPQSPVVPLDIAKKSNKYHNQQYI